MRHPGSWSVLLLILCLGCAGNTAAQDTNEREGRPTATGQATSERGERRGVRRLGDVLSEGNGDDRIFDLPETLPDVLPEPELAVEQEVAIETLQEIGQLMDQAGRALAQGRITTPPGDNAREYFEAVLRIDPANAAAVDGLREVEQRLCFTGIGDKIRPC